MDDYTFENTLGQSVIDYAVVRHDDIEMLWGFDIINCLEVVEDGGKN